MTPQIPQTAAPSAAGLSITQRQMIAHAILVAQNASDDLCSTTNKGEDRRPTAETLTRTVERLASIEATLKGVLA